VCSWHPHSLDISPLIKGGRGYENGKEYHSKLKILQQLKRRILGTA
jgi:hypothetical protein